MFTIKSFFTYILLAFVATKKVFFKSLGQKLCLQDPWGSSWQPPKNNQQPTQNNQSTNNNQNNQQKPPKNPKDPFFFNNLDDILQQIIKKFYHNNQPNYRNIAIAVFAIWLSLGVYKVNPSENGVVLYFGKFSQVASPGLNYYLPYPVGQLIKKNVTSVNIEEFGFSSLENKYLNRNLNAESLMLTGDENIVDVEFQIQWQISDIKDFVFNIADPYQSIRQSAESSMREIIARNPIANALSDGKLQIEDDAKNLLQEVLNSYASGIRIVKVQLRRVDPPSQVRDSFLDVQTAKADKEKEINQAQAYANDIIPRAKGLASQMKEEAEAYAKQVVANSEGEASRFLAVYNQYAKSKQVTKKRIYLETMEKIYSQNEKIYVDKNISKNMVMPYFFDNQNLKK
ncbi:MAG: FtsH protease activity modulator HflK [Proteobacteria bacterium]|jgi:membrane protease subunit HflK|nr:FtsH protease activity modulator HflK [Pseudomonadota bacterium]